MALKLRVTRASDKTVQTVHCAYTAQNASTTNVVINETIENRWTRNRKHRRAAAKPAACAPNAVNTREQGKDGGRVR